MKALGQKHIDRSKQIKMILLFIGLALGLIGGALLLKNRVNLNYFASGPSCPLNGAMCSWNEVIHATDYEYIVKDSEGNTIQTTDISIVEGRLTVYFTSEIGKTYTCKVTPIFSEEAMLTLFPTYCPTPLPGEDQVSCENGNPTPQPTSTPEPTISVEPTIITSTPPIDLTTTPPLTITPLPSTTPAPECYITLCDETQDCTIINESHKCVDVGGDKGKRCVVKDEGSCTPEGQTCWCTIQPTSTNTPTPSGDEKGDDVSATPTDIVIAKITDNPLITQEYGQATITPANITEQPKAGNIVGSTIILLIGVMAIVIPLFLL